MPRIPDPRFELSKITSTEWLIHDLRYRSNDPRSLVACVYEYSEVEVEVVWLRELPLATQYTSAFDALDELLRMYRRDRSAPVAAGRDTSAPALV
ncbi:MAG TPA: hypothetical protein VN241_02970 [Microbacterium sp.]|nr:hypothetical protein [Microbacterium sp.]